MGNICKDISINGYDQQQYNKDQEGIIGVILTHASSSGGRSKHGDISVNTFPKECGKERGSIQHVTHKVYRDGALCKQYTEGEFIFNSVTPTLPPPPSRQSIKSCLFTRHPKKAGFCRYTCIWITILYIKYSSLPWVSINNTDAVLLLFTSAPNESTKCASKQSYVHPCLLK